jgi:hypothetical protein
MLRIAFILLLVTASVALAANEKDQSLDLNVDNTFLDYNSSVEDSLPEIDLGDDYKWQQKDKPLVETEINVIESTDETRSDKLSKDKEFKLKLNLGF